ncbi:trichohyalin-like isoform X2 [Chelmon rostratus]|uniref:trichohyalin-like isoform X2 n=1 Tax=Chelmon rostratus TaxID=109905 RepID=UPI001BE748C3|nr:trichohyalin-like isoform X2 [Chelmon rostratus]XP_041793813.1 trichohyalin-like isoform X2 [Chelmon rostratus]XP_041793814.1 trichohyalin-like isoform X2 [Chelmon rostratus]
MAEPRRDQNSSTLHAKDRQSLMFQCGAFTVLVSHTVVFLALIHSCRGQSELIGPSQPIVATVGEDIILPCYLKPAMNAFDMTLGWVRPDLDHRVVLMWRGGVELENEKLPSYQGRSSLFTDELKHGNISLKLSKVKIHDEGRYRCFMPATRRAPTVQLVVGAVSSPVVQMTINSSGVLECESKGWYPEPEVFWLDDEGHFLSAGPAETVRGPDGLFTVRSSVTVEKRHSNKFTCRVQQKDINKTRETHIHVPDHSDTGRLAVIGSVIGCAALLAILTAVFAMWKWRQKKFRKKKDGSEHTQEEKTVPLEVITQDVMEGEDVALLAERGEESNVENKAEQKIDSQSEHEDLQFVAESETERVHLVTKPEQTNDMDSAGGERGIKSINNDKVPLTPTEGETDQMQDVVERQVNNNCDEGEEEQTTNPVKEDSGLPVVLDPEGKDQQQQNLHTDQEVQEEEETPQEPENDGSGLTGQKKKQENQTEPKQPEAERERVENQRSLQSELQKSKESEEEERELKSQTGNGSQHLSEDKTQDGSRTEHEGKNAGERNQSNTTERKDETLKEAEEERMENKHQSEKQEKIKVDLTGGGEGGGGGRGRGGQQHAAQQLHAKEEMRESPEEIFKRKDETLKEAEEERMENKHQSEKQEKTQKEDSNQHLSEDNKKEDKLEDRKGKDGEEKQSDVTRMTERTAESQKRTINEIQVKREERENQPPSVRTEATERTDTAERTNQELQSETQKGKNCQRNQEETKEQPERFNKLVTERESEERQEERLDTHRGADSDQTQEKSEETQQQLRGGRQGRGGRRRRGRGQGGGGGRGGQPQAAQQLDVKEEMREPPEEPFKSLTVEPFKSLTVRGAECQEESLEPMETDTRPDPGQSQRQSRRIISVKSEQKRRRKLKEDLNVDQQQSVRKKKHQDEKEEQKEKIHKRQREEQNENQSESEMELTDEARGWDMNSQQELQEEMSHGQDMNSQQELQEEMMEL